MQLQEYFSAYTALIPLNQRNRDNFRYGFARFEKYEDACRYLGESFYLSYSGRTERLFVQWAKNGKQWSKRELVQPHSQGVSARPASVSSGNPNPSGRPMYSEFQYFNVHPHPLPQFLYLDVQNPNTKRACSSVNDEYDKGQFSLGQFLFSISSAHSHPRSLFPSTCILAFEFSSWLYRFKPSFPGGSAKTPGKKGSSRSLFDIDAVGRFVPPPSTSAPASKSFGLQRPEPPAPLAPSHQGATPGLEIGVGEAAVPSRLTNRVAAEQKAQMSSVVNTVESCVEGARAGLAKIVGKREILTGEYKGKSFGDLQDQFSAGNVGAISYLKSLVKSDEAGALDSEHLQELLGFHRKCIGECAFIPEDLPSDVGGKDRELFGKYLQHQQVSSSDFVELGRAEVAPREISAVGRCRSSPRSSFQVQRVPETDEKPCIPWDSAIGEAGRGNCNRANQSAKTGMAGSSSDSSGQELHDAQPVENTFGSIPAPRPKAINAEPDNSNFSEAASSGRGVVVAGSGAPRVDEDEEDGRGKQEKSSDNKRVKADFF